MDNRTHLTGIIWNFPFKIILLYKKQAHILTSNVLFFKSKYGPSILKFQIFMKKYFLYIELILKWFFFLKTTLLNSFIKKENNYMIYIVSHKFKDFTRPPRKALVWNILGKMLSFLVPILIFWGFTQLISR